MSIKKQLADLDARIAYYRKLVSEHEERIITLVKQKDALYKDSGELPMHMRSETEKSAVLKMPFYELNCEYCGGGNVRKGKKIVCMDCMHLNGT